MILHLILIVTIVHKAMNDECVNVYRILTYIKRVFPFV